MFSSFNSFLLGALIVFSRPCYNVFPNTTVSETTKPTNQITYKNNNSFVDNNVIVKSSQFEGQLISNIKQLNSNVTLVLAHVNGSSTPYIATAQNNALNFTTTFKPPASENAIISLYTNHGLGIISVGEGDNSYVYYTTDGYQWKEINNFYWASEMVYGNGFWYVIGSSAENHGYPTVWSYNQTTSQGVITNIINDSESDNVLQALVFNNKLYVSYIDQNVNTHVLASDLVSTPSFQLINALDGGQNLTIFQNNLYVAGTQILAYSSDGVNWSFLEQGMNYFATKFYQTKDFLYYGNNNAVTLNTWNYYLIQNNHLTRTNWASNQVTQVLETSNTIFASEVDDKSSSHDWYQTTFDSPYTFKTSSFLSSHNVKQIALINNYLYAISSKDAYYSNAQNLSFQNFVSQQKWVANQTNFAYIFSVNNLVYFSSSEPTFQLWMLGTLALFQTARAPVFLDDNNPLTLNFKKEINISFFEKGLVQKVFINGVSVTLPSSQTIINSNTEMTIVVQGGQELDFYVVIKTSFDQSNLAYSVQGDTILNNDLTSNSGNTNQDMILQTKKKGSAQGPNSITISLKNNSYVPSASYYQAGLVKNNSFKANGTKNYFNTDQSTINGDGIFLVHIQDLFGYCYNALVEQGVKNWILTGQPNQPSEQHYLDEAKLLNIKVALNDGSSNVIDSFNKRMDNYQNYWKDTTNSLLAELVQKYGQGFSDFSAVLTTINQKESSYFEPIVYHNQINFHYLYALKQQVLKTTLINLIKAEVVNKLKTGINQVASLAKTLNITGQTNIHNADDLNKYTNFVKGYQSYLQNNYGSQWEANQIQADSYGYLDKAQIQGLEKEFNFSFFEAKALKNLTWNNSLVNTNQTYQKYVQASVYQNLVSQAINEQYHTKTQLEKAIRQAEANVNLYHHSVASILKYKKVSLPNSKQAVINFNHSNESFHTWLQIASNTYNQYLKQESTKKVIIIVSIVCGAVFLVSGFSTAYFLPKYLRKKRGNKRIALEIKRKEKEDK